MLRAIQIPPIHPVRKVAALLAMWEKGRMAALAVPTADRELIRDMILGHRHEIHRALDFLAPLAIGPVPRELAAFCYLVFAREDEKRAASFFRHLVKELNEGAHGAGENDMTRRESPVYRLARRVEDLGRRVGCDKTRPQVAALFFKSWVYYRIGLRMRRLNIPPGEPWWDLGPSGVDAEAV